MVCDGLLAMGIQLDPLRPSSFDDGDGAPLRPSTPYVVSHTDQLFVQGPIVLLQTPIPTSEGVAADSSTLFMSSQNVTKLGLTPTRKCHSRPRYAARSYGK